MALANELREQGIACEVYLNVGDKLGKQFGYADKLGIPFALVVGPDEREAGMVTVKSLKMPPPNQQTVERRRVGEVVR
jgi:histidyl-tRNA synthetase